jgi:hypothetical protein
MGLGAALLGLAALIVWGFVAGQGDAAREAERERPVKAPLRVSVQNGASVITLDAETLQRSGIETAAPEPVSYTEEIRAYAAVLDLARLTDLSNSYTTAQAQLQAARAKLAASKTAFERTRSLYEDRQNASLAQLQAAEATFRADESAVATAESQVRTLTATAQQEWGSVLGKALIDRSPIVTRLIERQDFLLQVNVPPAVSPPASPRTAHVQLRDGSRAAIAFVSPATRADPKIQGVSFFYIAKAQSSILPGMNLIAFLPSSAKVEGVKVPASAIVWWQDRAWVYSRSDANAFTRVQIATDLPASGGGYLTTTLPKGKGIVTQGAQLLLSEEFRAQLQVGEDEQ